MTYKFGVFQDNEWEEHRYGNVFAHEVYPDWSRVTIGADHKHIPMMLDIAKQWEGPYGILYVLVVPQSSHGAARYQSPKPCSFDDLELFSYTFQRYFEGDGRHHIWFMDISSNCRIIYDNHDLIYTYGNDNAVMDILKAKGFKESSPQMPTPHGHRFNQDLDKYEGEIMEYFEWITFPLNVEHDDPWSNKRLQRTQASRIADLSH